MNHHTNKSKKFYILLMIVVSVIYLFQIYNIFQFPSQIDIFKGDTRKIDLIFPFTATISEEKNNILKLSSNEEESIGLDARNSFEFKTVNKGSANIQLKIFGLFSVKSIKVNVVDQIYLIPGGQAIGVKLNTKGVLVVALSDIDTTDGHEYSPAKDAGIRIGDSIVEIDGIKVKDADHVIDLLNQLQNKEVKIKVMRNKLELEAKVKPVKSSQDDCYRLGIWVRDKTAGIGTLTFYEPESKKFGALGHGITDMDTGQLMPSDNGEVLKAKISSIQQGKKGIPGEIIGIFFEANDQIGKIERNTEFGIYGTAYKDIKNSEFKKPIPIGFRNKVREGKAYILSTTDTNKIERYEIQIKKIQHQSKPSQKSMIIEVTDTKLLEKTGGIVQGMSGSPIIQNGKIIGAVTHVFINDPTKGYGLYIEWMLKEAGILIDENTEKIVDAS